MTAEEQQGQRVVGGGRVATHVQHGVVLLPARAGVLAPELVDQPSGRRGHEPGPWVVGNSLGGPLPRRGEERLLHGVLGRVELTVAPHQRAEDLRRNLAQQVLDAVGVFACCSRGRSYAASAARRISATSILTILSMASVARLARSGSGSLISSPSASG